MSERESSPSSGAQQFRFVPESGQSDSSSAARQFRFVSESGHSEARSHAMREHWKKRHRRRQETRSNLRPRNKTLLPRHEPRENPPQESILNRASHQENSETDRYAAAQILPGLNQILFNSRPDPFQTCPVRLTTQHQKLLYHWIGAHAVMMFEYLDAVDFNPMRDVWFPLDLSNPSSFNCIMAHSAAHLAHLYSGTPPQRGTRSSDALTYKLEAVRILRSWLIDPEKELSDDSFAAVIRLLTFERYWGTVSEWKIHRDGLERMIQAKGGVDKLQNNWRLELVVYLVSLMSQPSWFEPTNHLEDISQSPFRSPINSPTLESLDVQNVRCLWLISFIQDMRTFMGSSYGARLPLFPSLHAAMGLLLNKFMISHQIPSSEMNDPEMEHELLGCLFAVGVVLQESICHISEDSFQEHSLKTLIALEEALRGAQDAWSNSIPNLRFYLYQSFMYLFDCGDFQINYVRELVDVLSTLSLDARQGVEKCLLNLFYSLGGRGEMSLIDDGWTPDSLLSSVHGH